MLASVIPPSILMIVAASTAGISIGQALMAGMVPGIFIGVAFMVYNYIHCKVTGMGEKSSFSAKRLAKSFISAVPALMVPVILLTGMYSGIYTPTEGAGIAVAYAVLVSIYVYKRLKWADIPRIIAKNARQTGTILFIAITAKPAGQIFELDGLPTKLANFILGISDNQLVIMFALFAFLIVVGMFMDATAAIYILVPILLPVVKQLGVEPLFFVVFLVIALSFGLITPPVGVCLYAAENVTGIPFETVETVTCAEELMKLQDQAAQVYVSDAVVAHCRSNSPAFRVRAYLFFIRRILLRHGVYTAVFVPIGVEAELHLLPGQRAAARRQACAERIDISAPVRRKHPLQRELRGARHIAGALRCKHLRLDGHVILAKSVVAAHMAIQAKPPAVQRQQIGLVEEIERDVRLDARPIFHRNRWRVKSICCAGNPRCSPAVRPMQWSRAHTPPGGHAPGPRARPCRWGTACRSASRPERA
mgnify:CR=1 FL=1